jgi:hypothetical protein
MNLESVCRSEKHVRCAGRCGLVYMQAEAERQDFGLLDSATGKSRRLTQFTDAATMRTFDVTPDGKQIVFDRLHEKSDVVLIDLPR